MYEPHYLPMLPRGKYYARLARHALAALLIVLLSIGLGIWGYWYFEGLPWLDGFLEAAMLLGGMGPVKAPQTPHGKLFAGLYALYAGLVFLAVNGIVFAPVVHRLLHYFHWKDEQHS